MREVPEEEEMGEEEEEAKAPGRLGGSRKSKFERRRAFGRGGGWREEADERAEERRGSDKPLEKKVLI
jgi:hypothetical protein